MRRMRSNRAYMATQIVDELNGIVGLVLLVEVDGVAAPAAPAVGGVDLHHACPGV